MQMQMQTPTQWVSMLFTHNIKKCIFYIIRYKTVLELKLCAYWINEKKMQLVSHGYRYLTKCIFGKWKPIISDNTETDFYGALPYMQKDYDIMLLSSVPFNIREHTQFMQ